MAHAWYPLPVHVLSFFFKRLWCLACPCVFGCMGLYFVPCSSLNSSCVSGVSHSRPTGVSVHWLFLDVVHSMSRTALSVLAVWKWNPLNRNPCPSSLTNFFFFFSHVSMIIAWSLEHTSKWSAGENCKIVGLNDQNIINWSPCCKHLLCALPLGMIFLTS